MANEVTTKITGLDELQTKLAAMEDRVAKKGIRSALAAGGKVLLNAVRGAAPVHTGFLSKHFGMRIQLRREELAGSIFVGPEGKIDYPKAQAILKQSLGKKQGQASKLLKNKKGRISVTSVVRFFEFGTSKMAKKPFMTQAGASAGTAAVDAAVTVLKEVVEGQ